MMGERDLMAWGELRRRRMTRAGRDAETATLAESDTDMTHQADTGTDSPGPDAPKPGSAGSDAP